MSILSHEQSGDLGCGVVQYLRETEVVCAGMWRQLVMAISYAFVTTGL